MAILVTTAIIAITIRVFFQGNDPLAGGDKLWRLSINTTIQNISPNTRVKIYPPFDTQNVHAIQRNISHPGFKLRKSSNDDKYQRSIEMQATDKGKQSIYANYLLHESETAFILNPANNELSTQGRERFLLDSEQLQYKSYAVKAIIKKLLKSQTNQYLLIDKIYRLAKAIPVYKGADSSNVPKILARNKATVYDRTLVMVALIRAIGIPARLISGVILKDDIETQPHYWVEAYQNGQWDSYDVHFGYKKTLPRNYLPLRRNNKNIVEVKSTESTSAMLTQVDYELEQEFNHPYLQKQKQSSISSVFNFTRLPLIVRDELSLLLLLPLGALITALFHHIVGVHNYGVFTPTLLSLAIVYADIMTTLVVFFVVIVLAISGRSFFPDSLTRIPRLSIIFTLIAIILTMSVSVLNFYNIDQSGKIILLPIIILTSLVDRFYRTIDDKGLTIALNRLAWTIFIALLCLPIIQFEKLGNLILQFPESHFFTLALFVWLSAYKGETLINLPLLKLFAEPSSPTKTKKAKPDAS